MHVHHVGFRIKGFYRLAQFGHRWEMTPNDAQHRLTILQFFARYGQAATCEAFGVSRRTLYRWKQTFTQADGQPAALAARSSAPCRRRQSMWPPALSQEIRRLRTTYPNLGKAKLHVLLRPLVCAAESRLGPVSPPLGASSPEPDKMRHAPSRLDARGRPKPVARPRKARQPKGIRRPLQVFACDTVVRLQAGLRRYLFTFIDPHTRFAVAFAAATPSSPPSDSRAGRPVPSPAGPPTLRALRQRLGVSGPLPAAPGGTRHHALVDVPPLAENERPRRTLQSHPPGTVRGLLSSGTSKMCYSLRRILSCSKKVTCVEVQGRGHLLIEVAIGNLIES